MKSKDYKDYPLEPNSDYMHSVSGYVQKGSDWIDDYIDDEDSVDEEGDLLDFSDWDGDYLVEVEFVDSDLHGVATGRWKEV